MATPGTIQFRSSDDWWQEDSVTTALREAEDNRPPQRPLIDGRTMNRFLEWCEQRQGLDRSLTQMQREHEEQRVGDVPGNGWVMPAASSWKRLPIIRHLRALVAKWRVERWYAYGPGTLGIRTGYDDWVVYGIWAGLEADQ